MRNFYLFIFFATCFFLPTLCCCLTNVLILFSERFSFYNFNIFFIGKNSWMKFNSKSFSICNINITLMFILLVYFSIDFSAVGVFFPASTPTLLFCWQQTKFIYIRKPTHCARKCFKSYTLCYLMLYNFFDS